MTEPADVNEYSKREYWDRRFSSEPAYDWFSSIYGECVSKLLDQIWVATVAPKLKDKNDSSSDNNNSIADGSDSKPQEGQDNGAKAATASLPSPARILHLGTGNSRLCHDLAAAWLQRCSEHNVKCDLAQTAVDFSDVVIANMKKGEQPAGPPVKWVVADIRDLSQLVPVKQAKQQLVEGNDVGSKSVNNDDDDKDDSSLYFDVAIDKGTLDAIQAAKDSVDISTLEDNIDRYMRESSRVLRPKGVLLQITWESVVWRKHWALREEYDWNLEEFQRIKLGDPQLDLYRMFKFVRN